MKFTAPLTATFAAVALIALPASGVAQSAPPSQPPATAQPPAPQTPPPQPPATAPQDKARAPHGQHTAHTANEHLMQAKTVLSDIPINSVTGTARTKLTELKRHMASLERSVSATAPPAKTPRAQRAAPAWATHLAAVDKSLTDLTSPATTLDDATRAKLVEVRSHMTAFAASMSGTATPASPSPAPHEPKTSPKPEDPSPAQTPAGPPAGSTVNKEAARRHLTAARDTLSQLTQLPEAAQLSGEARTQVSQLITNFNELITTQAEWRESFTKVQSNLTALLGAERTDESNVPPPATGTAGAVGTSGITGLDPKVREKLVEFRNKLTEFERASGGGGSPAPSPAPSTTTPANTPPAAQTNAPAGQPPAHAGHHPSSDVHTSAMHHIAAIEAILNPPSTTGAAADVKMDRTQLDQIRTHLNELKKLLQQERRE